MVIVQLPPVGHGGNGVVDQIQENLLEIPPITHEFGDLAGDRPVTRIRRRSTSFSMKPITCRRMASMSTVSIRDSMWREKSSSRRVMELQRTMDSSTSSTRPISFSSAA
jgi:arginyl-tRNA--protein-N-Asp/Glu arginylyltransferase